MPGPRTLPVAPCTMRATATHVKSGHSAIANNASAIAAAPTPTIARLAFVTSMSSPPGNCVMRPAKLLALSTNPMCAGSHPRSVRWTATKGPKPVSRAARKKFSQSSACRLDECGAAACVSSEIVTMRPSALGTLQLAEICAEAAALDRVPIASQDLELCLRPLAPKADVKTTSADAKVEHGQVGKPSWQQRIDVQFAPRSIGNEAKYRLQQGKDRTRRPGLWHVCPEILHRKASLVAFDRRIEFRQLIGQEVTCGVADVAGDPCHFNAEAIALEAQRDDGVVVRPD